MQVFRLRVTYLRVNYISPISPISLSGLARLRGSLVALIACRMWRYSRREPRVRTRYTALEAIGYWLDNLSGKRLIGGIRIARMRASLIRDMMALQWLRHR